MKILKYIALLIFSALWFTGCSKDLAQWLFEKGLIKDDYRYGDLYRMSNLAEFRVPVGKCIKSNQNSPLLPIKLTLAGDSFTEEGRIDSLDFPVKSFKRTHGAQTGLAIPDPQLENVLIIETVERHFRERFTQPWEGILVENSKPEEGKWYDYLLQLRIPYNTERNEAVLFGYDWVMRIREWKAALNFRLFGRTDAKVALSKNKEHLVYQLAVAPGISSSFAIISQSEIDTLVKNVNRTVSFYKQAGFERVALSIIPNKASILASDLGTYNYLIKRIQSNPDLQADIIDIYSDYAVLKNQVYEKGDTHWNCLGKSIWLGKVNDYLQKSSVEESFSLKY